MEMISKNTAILKGEITSEGVFNHEVFGEKFYQFFMSIKRQSEVLDTLPIIVSERLIKPSKIAIGSIVSISGHFRSFNEHKEEGGNKLILTVFVRELEFIEALEDNNNNNEITLEGYICKKPGYRQTPSGREICDILLAVNRPYGKSDYIPCISWGRNARFTGELEVGKYVKLTGRIQSREFNKTINENTVESRIAYEVSVAKIEVLED